MQIQQFHHRTIDNLFELLVGNIHLSKTRNILIGTSAIEQ